MEDTVFSKAKAFICKNGSSLDIARMEFHFNGGSINSVLDALLAYQNEDGGFGNAIEPDSWNPNSSPIGTWAATGILREIGFTDNSHPIISGILRYLSSGKDFIDGFWLHTIQSNNDYPHAPWWSYDESIVQNGYNPTAALAGFILRFADKKSSVYSLGCHIAIKAYNAFIAPNFHHEMHMTSCFLQLYSYCKEAEIFNLFDMESFHETLLTSIKSLISKDISRWETGYICKPSQFFMTKDNEFYIDNKVMAQYECDFILTSQLDDGSWNINWSWDDFPNEWEISKKWWKSTVIILNLLYLKGMGIKLL